jgi:hypothetical protein
MISAGIKEKTIGNIAVKTSDIPGYDNANSYVITNIVGDCMNHPDSPIEVGDGDHVMCHEIDRFEFYRNWERYKGRVIIFLTVDGVMGGKWYIKQFERIDYSWFMVLRMYNPPKDFAIAIDQVTNIYIVDRIVTLNNITLE